MKFSEIIDHASALLQQKGRLTYRSLKLEFTLDDEQLDVLKEELIEGQRVAVDEDGKVLVWVGNTEEDKGKRIAGKRGNYEAEVVSSQPSVFSPQLPTSSTQPQAAERRQLTVMFIDLVGSTTLSQQLDPEDYHARVQAYQSVCSQVIARYDGHIAQYLGDGVLVYFGYPAVHEDDAVRAVRSGLEIVAAVSRLQLTPPLHLRIGIHTGPVVVAEIGTGARAEQLALGETPNLAARIQGTAHPDEVMISAATYRLVEGLFECEDRGQPELKGVVAALTLYRVVKESEAHSRFEVVARRDLTPLVGREHEFGLLRERWERARDGEGQVVLLSGEPGIGKSRLVEALKDSLTHEGGSYVELRCSPYHQNSALYPVLEHVQRALQFQPADSAEQKLEKLEQMLSRSRMDLHETVPLLASLLSLPAPNFPLPTLSPQKQKEKTLEALVAWLCAEAQQQAVTYAWEDVHWADPSTLELLTLFVEQVPTTRVLAMLTFRPEFTPPWGTHSYLSQILLSRLSRAQVGLMVEKVTGGKALPAEVVQQIVSKTDGVPLFVEEITKSVVESARGQATGDGRQEGAVVGAQRAAPFPALGIPATLQDALMARLDRLGAAKEIAQVGATIGREFNYELLTAVSPLHEDALRQGLRRLVEAELVYQSGRPPQATYLFKHALIQDTAYQSLLKSRRQQLHQQIAQVLVEKFPQTVETQPELVAHHYTEAGSIEHAIPYWQHAGQRAAQRSAYVEAVNHLTKGLELLKALPDTPERTQRELTLHITLGPPLQYIKGWAAPETEQTHSRALVLCRQVGETPLLSSALYGLYSVYLVQGEYHKARAHAEQFLHLGENIHDPALLMAGHEALAFTLFWLGELSAARIHFEQGLAWHDPQQPFPTSVFCLSNLANLLWYLGHPDQGLGRAQEAVAVARQLSLPFHVVYALHYTAVLHYYRREERAAQEQAEAAMTLSREQGFPFWLGWATIFRGGALAAQGQGEAGISQIHQGIETTRATGARGARAATLSLLARAYEQVGQTAAGLNVLAEALAVVDRTGERWCEAELYRLKGILLLMQENQKSKAKNQKSENPNPRSQILNPDSQGEAEACFLKSLDIAHQQQAKSWELRTATSLARLWQQQGKTTEAHQMLSEIYNWFTEGFDTKDLQEAKELLEKLGD